MATVKPIKGQATASWCRSVNLDIVIDRDDFDVGALARVIPVGEGLDLASQTVSGPLRLGGRGKDDFRVVGSSAFHDTRDAHYHITVAGAAVRKPFAADKSVPAVRDFFDAVARGISPDADTSVVVLGQHEYPRAWWTGTTLPVPLPPPKSGKDHGAQLSGVEITYDSDTGTERLMVSAIGEFFSVVTMFRYATVVADLFSDAVQRSAEITARMFQEPSGPTE